MFALNIRCAFVIFFVGAVSGAKILAIVPTPSISHQVVFRPLWRELSLRGHDVVLMTTDPVNDKSLTNLTEIDLHFSYELMNVKHNITDIINRYGGNPFRMLDAIINMNDDICNEQLSHVDVQKLLFDEDVHFDLVMVEVLQPVMFAFGQRFDCSMIGIVSMNAQSAAYEIMGNPYNPITDPEFMLPFAGKLNFPERLISVLHRIFVKYYSYTHVLPMTHRTIQRRFGHNKSLADIRERFSMLFLNVHPALFGVRPLVPSVVDIGGGLHIQPPKPLPQVNAITQFNIIYV